MNIDATQVFYNMYNATHLNPRIRKSRDLCSPQKSTTTEAEPFRQFLLTDVTKNVVRCKPINELWAAANTLHFFADTEYAAPLRKYNAKECDRFLTDDQWIGAYGAIAMRQIRWCIAKLKSNPDTRRAFVSMGEMFPEDINRPACWNNLHFLIVDDKLSMHVYQRSLNLWHVMPYDVIVLTNILNMVASVVGIQVGTMHWTVGSLHMLTTADYQGFSLDTSIRETMLFDPLLLIEPNACKSALEHVQDFL